MFSLQTLLKKIKDNGANVDEELIKKAYAFAEAAHLGQFRRSGEPYIQHALAAAETLAEMKLDTATIAAGLLHDVVDDTGVSNEQIKKEFGKEIARLVEGITKLGKIKYRGVERQVENLRKMFLAMAEDIRVLLIKLSDRLHNMQTLSALPPEKQHRIALETMEIYVPLANRLGIGRIKGQLEDLSFQYLMPAEYFWLTNQVRDQYEQREKYLKKITPLLKKELQKESVKVKEIHWRAKHYYSLYQKLNRYEMNLNRVYDLVALRVIVENVEDCYAALGIIHKLWRPLPGRIKDYIALPKPNGYQSIHTTVFCQEGKITEIQIRTAKMHAEAERGIAAHWYYTEQKGLRAYLKKFLTPAPEKELKWIQQLRDWQKEIGKSPDEFFQALKIDFFKDRIFVFTAKGDVINLPEGATPVDFAYHIHTEIGHRCQGARADGKMVALDTSLKNGQVVEIITQKQSRPSRDWLQFAKTNLAKSRIKQWLNRQAGAFAPAEETEKEIKKPEPSKIVPEPITPPLTTQSTEVEVEGDAKISAKLARCCQPRPFDDIIGYITLQQRVTVHRSNCPNLARLKDRERIVRVSWKNKI